MDKEDERSLGFTILGLVLLICALFIFFWGARAGRDAGITTIRAEAVEQGVGEWVPDKLGRSTFRWKVDKVKTLPPDGPSVPDRPTGFHNPATAEDYEHMHDYLPQKEKPPK